MAIQADLIDKLSLGRQTQALRRSTTISAYQAASPQLYATKPPNHQHGHLITLLPFYGLQYGPARRTARLPVIVEAIFITYAVSPAIVSGFGNAIVGKKLKSLGWRLNGSGVNQEAAFLDVFLV